MTEKHTIHIYRQYLQTISDTFFPEITMFKKSALRQAKTFGDTSKEFFSALIISTHVNEITLYLKKRLVDTTKPVIKMQLTSAQVVCLYQILFNHPIANDKIYLLIVRQDAIEKLHQAIMLIALQAEVDGMKKDIAF